MYRITLFLYVLLAVCSKDVHCLWFRSQEERIVGGSETNITSYPYQAHLNLTFDNDEGYGVCGGIIISKTYILTAAHCLKGVEKVKVRIGSTYSDRGGKEYKAKNLTIHPKFNYNTADYDVGLVKTSKMELDGTNAKTINLVKSGYEAEDMAVVIVTGWGLTMEDGRVSKTLKVVELKIVNRKKCDDRHYETITSRMICAGIMEGGKDNCEGDSGGPAVLKSNNRAVGIVSFGDGCGRPNSPGVYANIGNPEIRKYIKDISGV